jgi:uncharacterized peroxidase-related enzyme
MVRNDERRRRADEATVVGSLPGVPGILAAMRMSDGLARHLRGLADELLVNEFPGSTLTRAERELLATAVSAGNDCFYCMDSHGAFAGELLRREGASDGQTLVDSVKTGGSGVLEGKMPALLHIARVVQRRALDLTRADVERALAAGATDQDTQLAVLIASAFCMYNRMVDGLRAPTPASPEGFSARAVEIADHGYSDPRVVSIPR